LALSKLYEKEDKPLTPYVDSPGAAIHHQGRYGGFMAEPLENHASLKACVESRIRTGADRLKLIATDIIDFKAGRVTKEPQMATQEVAELVSAARGFGKQTFAHASGDAGIEHAIAGGVDSIEHGFFIRQDQLARMRDQQIAWVPTFAPVQKQVDHAECLGWSEKIASNLRKILEQHAASLVKAHELGVQIIAGSDAGSCGVAHGFGLWEELELMERAGLSALAVINAATGTSSARLGYKEKFGQIKPGYRSRFIITPHSPLPGIANLKKHKYVVYDGEVYDSDVNVDSTGL
jgi:imidazolonepropionase-like amidohydrolase